MLLENERENEDMNAIGVSLRSNIKIDYNIKSLMKSEFIYEVAPELMDQSISDKEYLQLQRLKAEQKFIKLKIIYKLYNMSDSELTTNEKKYLKHWVTDLKRNQDRNILNLGDSLLP